MFNPNVIPAYSHRSDKFRRLFSDTIAKFKDISGLGDGDLVLLISGSGTLANEVVLSSMKKTPLVKTSGSFSNRLIDTAEVYSDRYTKETSNVGVFYETGRSKLCNTPSDMFFMDCISSFPYYDFPKNVPVLTTVSSKQFGAETGLSIVVVRDWVNNSFFFNKEQHTYTSLRKYANKSLIDETPNTPAITAIESFNTVLNNFSLSELRKRINACREILIDTCKSKGFEYSGEGPVFTFSNNTLPPEVEMLMYRNSGVPQMFLWDCSIENVENFVKGL